MAYRRRSTRSKPAVKVSNIIRLFDVKMETKEPVRESRTRGKLASQDTKVRADEAKCSTAVTKSDVAEKQSTKQLATGSGGAEANTNDKTEKFDPIEMRIHFKDASMLIGEDTPKEDSSQTLVNGAETNGTNTEEKKGTEVEVTETTNLVVQKETTEIKENGTNLETIRTCDSSGLKNGVQKLEDNKPLINGGLNENGLNTDCTKEAVAENESVKDESKSPVLETKVSTNEKDNQSVKNSLPKHVERAPTPPIPSVDVSGNDGPTPSVNKSASDAPIPFVDVKGNDGHTPSVDKCDNNGPIPSVDKTDNNGPTPSVSVSANDAPIPSVDSTRDGPTQSVGVGATDDIQNSIQEKPSAKVQPAQNDYSSSSSDSESEDEGVSSKTSDRTQSSKQATENIAPSSQKDEDTEDESSSESEEERDQSRTSRKVGPEAVQRGMSTDSENCMTKEELLNKIDAALVELELPNRPAVYLKKEKKLEDEFKVGQEVGRGRFGVVRRVIEKRTGREFAAKYITVNSDSRKETIEEIKMMNYIHNKRLVYLQDAYETKANVILLLEYIPGGELFEKICEDDNLTEREACRYMQQVLEGVYYLHRKGIVHLDLKPENILCVPKPEGKDDIKLIDFGMARFVEPGLRIACGTPEFVAPEVLGYEEVTLASDMWSIGVITFVLLSGLSPFLGDSDVETIGNVSRGEWDDDFEDEDFEHISELAKDFIRELLVMDPKKRNDVKKCLTHDWILAYHGVPVGEQESTLTEPTADEKRLSQLPERKLSIKHLKRFIARRRWQRTLKAVRAMTRLRMFGFMRSASQDKSSEVAAGK